MSPTETIKIPIINIITNPYILDMIISGFDQNKYFKGFELNKIDMTLTLVNTCAPNETYNRSNKKKYKHIKQKIKSMHGNNFVITYKTIDDKCIIKKQLNNKQTREVQKNIKEYIKEYHRVIKIYNIFKEEYIGKELKPSHLSNKCSSTKRKNCDNCSKTNIRDLIDIIDQICKNKQQLYDAYISKFNITEKKKDENMQKYYIFVKIDSYFQAYFQTIIYCLIMLNNKPYYILNPKCLMKIKNDSFNLGKNNKIIINHMDTIQNTTITKNNKTIVTAKYIILSKLKNKNNIWFDNNLSKYYK
jgi:hypothetical protein